MPTWALGSWRGAEQGPCCAVSWGAAWRPPAPSPEGRLGALITAEPSCVHGGLRPLLGATAGTPTHNLVPLGAGEEGVLVVTPEEAVGCGAQRSGTAQECTWGAHARGLTPHPAEQPRSWQHHRLLSVPFPFWRQEVTVGSPDSTEHPPTGWAEGRAVGEPSTCSLRL